MKNIIISGFLLLFFLTSCNQGTMFSKYHKLKDYQWDKDNIIVFEVPAIDKEGEYDVILAVRHTPQYPYANLQLNMTMYSPSGEERTKDHDLYIRNNDGTFKGEGMGDLFDIEFTLLSNISFSGSGLYKFELHSLMPRYTTPAIMELGLIIKQSE